MDYNSTGTTNSKPIEHVTVINEAWHDAVRALAGKWKFLFHVDFLLSEMFSENRWFFYRLKFIADKKVNIYRKQNNIMGGKFYIYRIQKKFNTVIMQLSFWRSVPAEVTVLFYI